MVRIQNQCNIILIELLHRLIGTIDKICLYFTSQMHCAPLTHFVSLPTFVCLRILTIVMSPFSMSLRDSFIHMSQV